MSVCMCEQACDVANFKQKFRLNCDEIGIARSTR